MSLVSYFRGKLTPWPALILAGALILFVLGSVHFASKKFTRAREQELLMHAHKVASALKAQIFERYADSQAFALQPTFHTALQTKTPQSIKRSGEVLKELLNLYQVYRASILTDVDGKPIAAALESKPEPVPSSYLQDFVGENARLWVENPPSPRTKVSELMIRDDWKILIDAGDRSSPASSSPLLPLQMFTSPIRDTQGKVLGAITNYTSGLYLEREMSLAFEDFARLNLSGVSVYLVNRAGQVIAVFRKGFTEYTPRYSRLPEFVTESGLKDESGQVFAWTTLSDPRIKNAVTWTVVLSTDREFFFGEVERLKRISYAVAGVILSILLYASAVFHQMRLHHERTIAARLQEAQEAERARISREIHDDLGQNLTAIKIHLSRAESADPATLASKLEDAKSMIEETNRVIRRISRDLHPSLVESFGLAEALRWKLGQLEGSSETRFTLSIEDGLDIEHLPQVAKRHIFRIVQESLNNVQKHAEATEVRVRFEKKGQDLCFSIRDNGVGFETRGSRASMGLISMDERAQLIGGRVRVTSKPGEGTTVLGWIPWPKEGSLNGE